MGSLLWYEKSHVVYLSGTTVSQCKTTTIETSESIQSDGSKRCYFYYKGEH